MGSLVSLSRAASRGPAAPDGPHSSPSSFDMLRESHARRTRRPRHSTSTRRDSPPPTSLLSPSPCLGNCYPTGTCPCRQPFNRSMSLLRDACACLAPAAVPRLPRSCLTHQANFSSPISFPAVAWPRHLLPRRCRRPHQANLSSPISSPAVAWPRRSPPDLLPRRRLHAGPPPRQAFPLHIFQYFNSSYFQDMPNQHVLNKYVDEVLEYLQSRATEPPKLICGCGQPATCCTVSSPPNQKNKRFFCKTCNMRIWEDTLKKFVDDMLFYCQAATIDSLTSELQNSNRVLLHKDKQIAAMEAELMKVKDDAELMKVNDEEHWKSAPSAVVEEQKTVGQRRSCFCNVCIFVMVSAIILKLIL